MDGDNAVQAARPRGFRQLKIKPPHFGAKPKENIKIFFSKFEKFLNQQGVEQENRIDSLGLCLENEAIETYDNILLGNGEIDYEDLKEQLILRFNDDRISLVIRAKMNNTKLQPNQSISEFFNQLRKDADRYQIEDQALLAAFIAGLPPGMAEKVAALNPQNSLDAYKHAKTLHEIRDLHKPIESKNTLNSIKADLAREAKVAAATSTQNNELHEVKSEMAKLREAFVNPIVVGLLDGRWLVGGG